MKIGVPVIYFVKASFVAICQGKAVQCLYRSSHLTVVFSRLTPFYRKRRKTVSNIFTDYNYN